MKTTTKRTYNARPYVSAILALALVFSLLTALPITAAAVSWNIVIEQIQSISSITTRIQSAIDNASSGGSGEFTQGSVWYQVYVDYAISNGIIDANDFSDYNSGTPYYSAILIMYKAGVVGGDEWTNAFRPGDSVSRAEASAIIARVILPASRLIGNVYG